MRFLHYVLLALIVSLLGCVTMMTGMKDDPTGELGIAQRLGIGLI